MELVPTKQTPGGKLYRCPADGWVEPKTWSGTGYKKFVCPRCNWELDNDPFGEIAWEKGENRPKDKRITQRQ